MNASVAPMVVLGVGNILLRDDGVGVRVVEALGRLVELDPAAVPCGTRLVDGGTLGPDLLRTVEGARAVLIVDAIDVGEAPGTVQVLRGDAITASGGRRSGSVQDAVGELLAMGRLMGWVTGPVALVGIQVAEIEFALGMSEAVAAAVPLAVETVRATLGELDREAADARRGAGPTSVTGVAR